ncbi:MAG TPA: hypothetical protein VFP44_10285 [Usitatibacter sp.]|nr:hypothetical protein [Usitatibacter sp.]
MKLPPEVVAEVVLASRTRVAEWLAGEPTHGTLWRAGLPKTLARGIA